MKKFNLVFRAVDNKENTGGPQDGKTLQEQLAAGTPQGANPPTEKTSTTAGK